MATNPPPAKRSRTSPIQVSVTLPDPQQQDADAASHDALVAIEFQKLQLEQVRLQMDKEKHQMEKEKHQMKQQLRKAKLQKLQAETALAKATMVTNKIGTYRQLVKAASLPRRSQISTRPSKSSTSPRLQCIGTSYLEGLGLVDHTRLR
ncbi:uncharacterized protein IUM83_02557 [Phytophthora cinnamomi]|uniref:uncharacterized protein n=1 Tax=Phytophthora cinnamomi TaxID=4785 RepID=UPI0035598F7B|nr:hypothetical protein IUM83_02557 [Phytophthora cinnamomi]